MLEPATAPQVVLGRLIDYAGMYPPEALPLEDAVTTYHRHRVSPYEWMLGPFLCPSSQLHDLEWLLGGERIPVGVVLDQPASEAHSAIEASGLDLRHIETRNLSDFEILKAAPGSFTFWIEAPVAEVFELAIRHPGKRMGVKIRCGGDSPDKFPTAAALAEVMHDTFACGLPMKATAGLHHPFRHFSSELGVWRHGFLNLAAAATALVMTSDRSEAEKILSIDEPGFLAPEHLRLGDQFFSTADLKSGRVFFRSYGSCSFDEPVDDLLTMGVLWGAR